MAITRTNTSAPQAQPESLLGRGWRAFKETINPTPTRRPGPIGPDSYTGTKTTADVAGPNKLRNVEGGRQHMVTARMQGTSRLASDQEIFGYLDELGSSGAPTRRTDIG